MIEVARLDDLVAEQLAKGRKVIQEGRVLRPGEQGVAFTERVEGCTPSLIRDGDSLIDDHERWVHLR